MASKIKGLTVEIGGDVTKLSKALTDANRPLKQMQTELNQVNRLLKLDPTNTELLTQKQTLLKKSIGETEEKLKILRDAEKQNQALFEKGELPEEEYRALQREIVSTEQKLQGFNDELKTLEQNAGKSSGALDKFAEKSTAVGEKAEKIGKKLAPVSTAAAAVGTASIAMAATFEDSMAKLSTIADETEVPIKELEKQILELSNQTGISSSEIANNVYDAISAGQSTGDAVNFVGNATKLAKAGFADAGQSLDILTTILNSYGLASSEVSKVSDILINTQNKGKVTVAELSASMGKVIPTANAFGVNLEQVATGYAIMTAKGVKAAETTTYMNSMFNEMGKSGTKASDLIKEISGKSFQELIAEGKSVGDILALMKKHADANKLSLADMFGSAEAGKAALILSNNAGKDFNDMLKDMNNTAGATDTAFDKLDTNSNKAKRAFNTLKNTGIELGTTMLEALSPAIEAVGRIVSNVSNWFHGLNDTQKKVVATIIALLAAVAPALIIFGKVSKSISSMVKVFKTLKTVFLALKAVMIANPFTAIVVAIVAVIAIVVTLYNKCEWFRDAVNAIFNAIKEFVLLAAEAIKNFFIGIWNKIQEIWNLIKSFLDTAVNVIKNIFQSTWNAIKAIWSGVVSFFVGIWTGISNVFSVAADVLGGFFSSAWNMIQSIFSGFVSFFNGLWDNVKNIFFGVADFFRSIFDNAWNCVKNAFSGFTSFFGGLWDSISRTFSNLGTNIGDAIGGAVKAGINGIIWSIENIINGGIGLINGAIDLINNIPGVDIGKMGYLDLPRLWKGGVLQEGQAMVAEAGPELLQMVNGRAVVTPLTSGAMNRNVDSLGGGGTLNATFAIENFYNNREQDIEDLTREVLETAQSIQEREGKVF